MNARDVKYPLSGLRAYRAYREMGFSRAAARWIVCPVIECWNDPIAPSAPLSERDTTLNEKPDHIDRWETEIPLEGVSYRVVEQEWDLEADPPVRIIRKIELVPMLYNPLSERD